MPFLLKGKQSIEHDSRIVISVSVEVESEVLFLLIYFSVSAWTYNQIFLRRILLLDFTSISRRFSPSQFSSLRSSQGIVKLPLYSVA